MKESLSVFESIIFSGIQATGNLHLGNYLGALKNFVDLQNEAIYQKCFFSIVDLHALTINPDPQDLKNSTREVAAAFLAAGLDPEKNIIFNQSRVYQHCELAWIFNCVVRIGWLNRMTQFKDKAGKNKETASLGLYAYPTLMAADILLYKATHVPIGDDQKQHIELTRDIAQKFNNDYDCNFFPLPEPLFASRTTRVMSLRDGSKKMSKSDISEFSRIHLSDSKDIIVQKIKKAKTDSNVLPDTMAELNSRLEARNLISIYASFANLSEQESLNLFAGKQFSQLKEKLIEIIVPQLEPIGEKLTHLLKNPDYIDEILKKGAEKASVEAEKTMKNIREIVGLL